MLHAVLDLGAAILDMDKSGAISGKKTIRPLFLFSDLFNSFYNTARSPWFTAKLAKIKDVRVSELW